MRDGLFEEIRGRLIDLIFLALAILMIPVIVLNFVNAMQTGFTMQRYVTPVVFLISAGIYCLRHVISIKIKIRFYFAVLTITALLAFYSYGLIGMGVSLLLYWVHLQCYY